MPEPGQFLLLQTDPGIYKYELDSDLVTELWPSAGAYHTGADISPDGTRIAFSLYGGGEEAWRGDVWVMANDGSGIRGVSAPPPERTAPESFVWSPDGTKIAYITSVPYLDDERFESHYLEVYVVDRNGTNRRRLSAEVLEPDNADAFTDLEWSPDGRYVAWLAHGVQDKIGTGQVALDVYDTESDERRRLPFTEHQWAPDGSRILYRATVNGVTELYTRRPDGTERIKISPPALPSGRAVVGYAWSPDGTRIAYAADADTDDVWELYVAASDGAGTVKINGALVDGTGVSGFRWAPDGSRIAYALFSEPELYTVRPDGNGHVKVSGPLGADDAITLFKWSPDGAWLAYRVGASAFDDREIHVVRADGTGFLEVEGVLPGEPVPTGKGQGWFESQHFEWSPDNEYLVFVAIRDTPDVVELYTLQPDTAEYSKLNDPVTGGKDLRHSTFAWSRDGSRLAFYHDGSLHVVAPNGAAYRNFSPSIGTGRVSFEWSP